MNMANNFSIGDTPLEDYLQFQVEMVHPQQIQGNIVQNFKSVGIHKCNESDIFEEPLEITRKNFFDLQKKFLWCLDTTNIELEGRMKGG